MKKSIVTQLVTLTALLVAPSLASAAYVCRVIAFPSNNQTLPYRIQLTVSASANCAGAQTTYTFCERGYDAQTTTICPASQWRFDKPDTLALYSALVNAADTQQIVAPHLFQCGSGAGYCGQTVEFQY